MSERVAVGEVSGLLILPEAAKIVSTPVPRVRVTKAGFEGDRHAGLTRMAGPRDTGVRRGTELPNQRQVSIVSDEEMAEIATGLNVPQVKPQWLGANLALRGVRNLTRLPAGSRLRFSGGVELRVKGENQPCRAPGEAIAEQYPEQDGIASRFAKEALHLRGLVGWVERPGELTVGEAVEIWQPEADPAA